MRWDHLLAATRSLLAGSASAPGLDEPVRLPSHGLYVHWDEAAPASVLEWDVAVRSDPGSAVGEYLALRNGSIDGAAFYLGLQTDVLDPRLGRGVGKGLIFSTWWSFDAADTRVAEPDGFRQLGTHEGTFVGVRRPYQWGVGAYRVTLARGDADIARGCELDWFDLSIRRLASPSGMPSDPLAGGEAEPDIGPATWVGSIRFRRRRPGRPATVDPGGLLFAEVYSGARTWATVPLLEVDVVASADGRPCPAGRVEYPSFPHGQTMPNAVGRHLAGGAVEIRYGGTTTGR